MKEQKAWKRAREALTVHRPRVGFRGRVGVSGAVREQQAIDRSERLLHYYSQTDNIQHFE
jgi:hypothetical protein